VAKAVFRIEHRLGIAAPAEVIWEVISDLERWAEWNPLYVQAQGRLRIGGQLTLTEAIPGREHKTITPSVVDWVPDAQILWRMSETFGLLKRLRYFEIETLSEEGCIFANGEDWFGRPARYVAPAHRRAMRQGFEALGEAVRERALQLWRDAQPEPISAKA
jgi:hypothetical protein